MKISIAFYNPKLPKDFLNNLQILGEVSIFDVKKLSEQEIIEKMPETEILICGSSGISKLGQTVFDGLKNLKFIAVYGVGYDWIDIEQASKKGVVISTTIGSNSEAVAEHIWGMILNLSKRISELERKTRLTGETNVMDYPGLEIFGKTIGIIGLGEIGKRVAKIATGFNMRIIGTNKSGSKVDNIEIVNLEYLLNNSDVITLCVPLDANTENIIDEDELNIMKKDVILVNASREKLVNKKAVLKALAEKKLFGYGIETEIFDPILPSDDYFNFSNVLLTPHNAWNTKESKENDFSIMLQNVQAFIDNKPINVVRIKDAEK
ncbi:MAG: hypothetical protein RI980_414 [Bacteroidota bacterium]|jgi:phosphoglycerate dehydrogenase-like enzyme|nr:MAG: hypothetical protein EAY77_01890 [Flavobacteriia bacterium]